MIDLHLHTTASDGRLPPDELVRAAAAAGLRTIAVTDHDTVAGLEAARAGGTRVGVRVIPGIEMTAVEDGRDVHILGYFFDPSNRELVEFLKRQRRDRIARVRQIAARLEALGYPVDVETIIRDADRQPGRTIGRPQIADALVRAGCAPDRAAAFDALLGAGRPGFVARRGPAVAEVVGVIHGAGGVAAMAHPGLTSLDGEIPRFAASGLDAIEVRHSDHTADDEARYRALAATLGLLTTAGSDFHADPSQHRNTLGVVSLSAPEFAALEARAAERTAGRGPR